MTCTEDAAAGVDYDDVVTRIEEDGVSNFGAAWHDLASELQAVLEHPASGQ